MRRETGPGLPKRGKLCPALVMPIDPLALSQERDACLCTCCYVAWEGAFRPNSFITICRSFQASFFWRGSRSRKAGW